MWSINSNTDQYRSPFSRLLRHRLRIMYIHTGQRVIFAIIQFFGFCASIFESQTTLFHIKFSVPYLIEIQLRNRKQRTTQIKKICALRYLCRSCDTRIKTRYTVILECHQTWFQVKEVLSIRCFRKGEEKLCGPSDNTVDVARKDPSLLKDRRCQALAKSLPPWRLHLQ
jgi:hypothetical protein